MPKIRYRPSASKTPIEYDQDGRTLCRQCKNRVPSFRATFCSASCVHEWKMRTNKGYVLEQVLKRDRGICARCGLDCIAYRKSLINKPKDCFLPTEWEAHHKHAVSEGGGLCGLDNYETLCRECHRKESADLAAKRATKIRNTREIQILMLLHEDGWGCTVKEISAATGLSDNGVRKYLPTLTDKGFIVRQKNFRYDLTQEGESYIQNQ